MRDETRSPGGRTALIPWLACSAIAVFFLGAASAGIAMRDPGAASSASAGLPGTVERTGAACLAGDWTTEQPAMSRGGKALSGTVTRTYDDDTLTVTYKDLTIELPASGKWLESGTDRFGYTATGTGISYTAQTSGLVATNTASGVMAGPNPPYAHPDEAYTCVGDSLDVTDTAGSETLTTHFTRVFQGI